MQLGLINSAWAQAGRDTAFGIRMTKEIGFDTIDIFADPLDIDVKERRLIKRECDRAGLPIVSVACVAVGLIDFNPSVQRFHMERCRAYLDLAYEYRGQEPAARPGRIHLGAAGDPAGRAMADRRPQRARAGQVRRRPGRADRPGAGAVQAVAGQQRRHDGALPRRRESSGRAGQHRHLAPATVAARRPEELRRLKGKAIHVHLSDCDGKVHGDLPPGRGVVDFRRTCARSRRWASTAR